MRFYLHYRDPDRYYPDEHGADYVDLVAAEDEARQSVRDLLGLERAELDPAFQRGVYEIADDDGKILATVVFSEHAALRLVAEAAL
jgi:hypothetical protein